MKLRDLKSVLYSDRGCIQFAIVYDHERHADIAAGCSVEYAVKEFGDKEVKQIGAFENQLLITV